MSSVLGILSGLGTAAGAVSSLAGAANSMKTLFNETSNLWGSNSKQNSSSNSSSNSYGESWSASGSQAGSNDDVNYNSWANAMGLQNQYLNSQQNYNMKSMLMQMGYNTMGSIMQGVYNGISQKAAMEYNSAEAQKTRDWQENLANTSYQRAVADLKAAGLNPILAAGATSAVPAGATANSGNTSISAPNSAMATSGLASAQQQASSYSSSSWAKSQAYNTASSISQMISEGVTTPVKLNNLVESAIDTGQAAKNAIMQGGQTSGNGGGRGR